MRNPSQVCPLSSWFSVNSRCSPASTMSYNIINDLYFMCSPDSLNCTSIISPRFKIKKRHSMHVYFSAFWDGWHGRGTKNGRTLMSLTRLERAAQRPCGLLTGHTILKQGTPCSCGAYYNPSTHDVKKQQVVTCAAIFIIEHMSPQNNGQWLPLGGGGWLIPVLNSQIITQECGCVEHGKVRIFIQKTFGN